MLAILPALQVNLDAIALQAYTAGVEVCKLGGMLVKLYGPEKTLADCFNYRNKIGLDRALKALRRCRSGNRYDLMRLQRFSRVCRVERLMRLYL